MPQSVRTVSSTMVNHSYIINLTVQLAAVLSITNCSFIKD